MNNYNQCHYEIVTSTDLTLLSLSRPIDTDNASKEHRSFVWGGGPIDKSTGKIEMQS